MGSLRFLSLRIPLFWLALTAGLCLVSFPAWAYYSVHVSSFRHSEDADREVAGYRERGLDCFSRHESVTGQGMWHRVYVGRFSTAGQASNLAKELIRQGVLSRYSNYRIVYLGVGDPTESEPAAPRLRELEQDASAFRETIEGSYVGSYRYKWEAQRQAEGLTLRGWPAFVVDADVKGVPWYRVYISPDQKLLDKTLIEKMRLKGFEILADMSYTIYPEGAGQTVYYCQGMDRHQTYLAILRNINAAVPEFPLKAALREVGYMQAQDQSQYSRLDWGVSEFDRAGYGQAINRLAPSAAASPLGWGLAAADAEMVTIYGRKALIVLSDFRTNRDLAQPVVVADKLKAKYGEDLCIYTIYVDTDAEGVRIASGMAAAGQCGNFYDGCLLMSDRTYFDAMIREIFYGNRAGRTDSDRDGVPDDLDKCPNTPLGVAVDERGCWVVAFAQYFDFDKAVVKKQYIPNLKQAADILKLYPDMRMVVAGHTDSVGSSKYNYGLGLRRARAVRDKLIGFGVNPKRLKVISYGETRPAASNATPEGRAKNRRVEFEEWGNN